MIERNAGGIGLSTGVFQECFVLVLGGLPELPVTRRFPGLSSTCASSLAAMPAEILVLTGLSLAYWLFDRGRGLER